MHACSLAMVICPLMAIRPPQLHTWTSWPGTVWCSLSSTLPVLCAARQGTAPSLIISSGPYSHMPDPEHFLQFASMEGMILGIVILGPLASLV